MAGPQKKTLQELAVQKEQELQRIREQQYHALETALKSREEELQRETEKRKALEDDFKYNLNLIEQRDQELAQYDTVFQQLKKAINSRAAEISDLHVQIDELQLKLKEATEEKGRLKQYYNQRLEQQQAHMDQFCKSKDKDIAEQRLEYERLQKQLQQRLLQIEEELESEKQQLSIQYEEKLKTQGSDNQRKLDELAAALLSKESHIRQLQRELSTVQSSKEETHRTACSVEERVKLLETQIRDKDWDHTDAINTLEARISELEGQLSHAEATNKNIRSEFDIRRIELERLSKEKETTLQTAKECHRVRETELERQVGEMRAHIEQLEIEGRRKEWSHKDDLTEKELTLDKIREELLRVREEGERQLAHHAQEKVQLDLKLQSLQLSYDKVKDDLHARIQDIERYKHELHLAVERERCLERSKNQLELDWQARLEEMERNQYGRQEELLKTLTSARDEAVVYCKQVEGKLIERVKVCESIRQERDIALDALKKKGLTSIAQEILAGRGSSAVLESLQSQNQELREVISHMRTEMEQLAGAVSEDPDDGSQGNKRDHCSRSYIRYIERELGRLKQENQRFHETYGKKPPTPPRQGQREKKAASDPQVTRAVKIALVSFQKEKATYEFDLAQLRSKVRQLESSMRTKQEQVYMEKALQVPPDKVRQKLLQATQVIIQLVKEREDWKAKEEELTEHIARLQQNLKQHEEILTADQVPEDTSSSPVKLSQNDENIQPSLSHETEPLRFHQSRLLSLQEQVRTKPLSSCSRLNIPEILTPKKHLQDPTSKILSQPDSTQNQIHENLSLSPLKFSDASNSSGLQGLQKVLELVDGSDTGLLWKSSTPAVSDEETEPLLVVQGKKVSHETRGRGKVTYNVPHLRKNTQNPKIRNYNIKDE